MINIEKLHTTIIYSRVNIKEEYIPTKSIDVYATGKQWDFFDPESSCLVLILDCPWLINRQKMIIENTNAVSDYDTYRPHITIARNININEIKSLPDPKQFKFKFEREYYKQIKLNS